MYLFHVSLMLEAVSCNIKYVTCKLNVGIFLLHMHVILSTVVTDEYQA